LRSHLRLLLFPYTTLFRSACVRGVMHAVVRRRVENPFERSKPRRVLGVEEELIEQVEKRHPRHRQWMKADQRQRQEEEHGARQGDRKSTRLNSSHQIISYA